jgi:TPP-dependent pyruvate/acetoin dehydrogenase alpha subunit
LDLALESERAETEKVNAPIQADIKKLQDAMAKAGEPFRAQLLEERVLNEEQYEAIDAAAKQESEDSVRFAEESPIPSVESITEDVYFEVDRHTAAGRTGRHFFNY